MVLSSQQTSKTWRNMVLSSQQEHFLEAQIYLREVCFIYKESNLVVVSRFMPFIVFERLILNQLSYCNMITCWNFILYPLKIFILFFVVVRFFLDELFYYHFHWCVCALIRMCEIGKNVCDHIEQLLCRNEI